MDKKEVKLDKHFSAGDAADFLQTLAEVLRDKSGKDIAYEGIQLQGLKKVKIHLKQEGDQFNLKLNLKYRVSSPENKTKQSEKPVGYKTIKKEINRSFKNLKTSIDGGSLPPVQTVDTFIQQVEHMITFKNLGYGDEYYEEFLRLCHDFKKSFQTGDIKKLLRAYNNIDARKALCHDKYD